MNLDLYRLKLSLFSLNMEQIGLMQLKGYTAEIYLDVLDSDHS